MARRISSVGVVGLGTMGAGIVEVFARGGLEVVGVEATEALAGRGREILQASTGRAVRRGKLSEEEQQALLDRVTVSTELADLAGADLVVEAVPELMSVKHDVFTRLDDVVAEDAVLATNTSSLSVTEIAAGTRRPERVVGMHFFNPAPVLRLVEVITTPRTDPEASDGVRELAEQLGKEPVVVGDRAGFVANYLLFGYLNSALTMIEQRHVSREDLDAAMRVGAGLPMGPLTLMDLIGLDVCHHIGEVIYGHSRSPLHAPSTMLGRMVTSGRLGRKSGQGFYTYASAGSGEVVPDELTPADPGQVEVPQAVGVVGSGPLADDLAGRLDEAGFSVTHVPDAGGDLGPLGSVGLVIEAQEEEPDPESEPAGRDVDDLFAELGEVTAAGALLTTVNTYSGVALGAISGRAGETTVLRVHAPTPHGQVIEIGRNHATAETTVTTLREVVRRLEAVPVVARDRTGLVVDALLVTYLNDAVRMLDEGYASVDQIDTAIRHGLGYPMGPFEMIDHIGADEVLVIAEELYSGSAGYQPHLAPSPLLVEHVLLDRPFTEGAAAGRA